MNSAFQSKKALVVDNSPIITKIIKNFLTKTGFEKENIFVAHDRNQALMMFELEKFDLVTSGIHLKDSTGIDFLKEIREQNDDAKKEIPFLIISADKQESYLKKLKEHNSTDYLSKPFNQNQFEKMICSILNCANLKESEEDKPAKPAPTPDSSWEDSPVEVPAPIVKAFTECTIEALEQYMAEAVPESPNGPAWLNGYFSAWVDLLSAEDRIQITMLINFPKEVACGIYEEIFGEVDIEQVCGVVQELTNIIGGIVKPRISSFSRDIANLIYDSNDIRDGIELVWDLGLPESKMGEDHSQDIALNGVPKFHVPFKIKDQTFHLVVLIQKY